MGLNGIGGIADAALKGMFVGSAIDALMEKQDKMETRLRKNNPQRDAELDEAYDTRIEIKLDKMIKRALMLAVADGTASSVGNL